MLRICRSGHWVYGGSARKPVDVVALPYDFWFELGRSSHSLEPGERPRPLGPDGVLYYGRFRHAGEAESPTWPDTSGYAAVEDAMRAAQERAPTPIVWD
ncbi:hypothetical protein ACVU7I_16305 [Patulibacter sp. S7RM1-6]